MEAIGESGKGITTAAMKKMLYQEGRGVMSKVCIEKAAALIEFVYKEENKERVHLEQNLEEACHCKL